MKAKIVSCDTADSKPVKQEVSGTVILPPLEFPALSIKLFSPRRVNLMTWLSGVSIPLPLEVVLSFRSTCDAVTPFWVTLMGDDAMVICASGSVSDESVSRELKFHWKVHLQAS